MEVCLWAHRHTWSLQMEVPTLVVTLGAALVGAMALCVHHTACDRDPKGSHGNPPCCWRGMGHMALWDLQWGLVVHVPGVVTAVVMGFMASMVHACDGGSVIVVQWLLLSMGGGSQAVWSLCTRTVTQWWLWCVGGASRCMRTWSQSSWPVHACTGSAVAVHTVEIAVAGCTSGAVDDFQL